MNRQCARRSAAVLASGVCLIALLIRTEGALWWAALAGGAGALAYALYHQRVPPRPEGTPAQRLLAGALTLCYLWYFAVEQPSCLPWTNSRWALALLAALGAPALWLFVERMLCRACRLYAPAARRLLETPLKWLMPAAALGIVVIYAKTTLFYAPTMDGNLLGYDRFFTSDTGALVYENVWLSLGAPENDLRQPLFALFAMPVAIPLYLLTRALLGAPYAYACGLGLAHWALLLLSFGMLMDAADVEPPARAGLLAVLMGSYPTLIFMLNLEQYVFAVFWLISLLYASLRGRGGRRALYIAAAGSLATSGLWFPLLSRERSWRAWLKDALEALAVALVLFAACDRLSVFAGRGEELPPYSVYLAGEATFGGRLLQYLNFIGSCLLAPAAFADDSNGKWRLAEATGVNPVGVALLMLAAAGVALYWRKPLMRVCAVWMGFSFALLAVAGLGASENGMVLYTLYFAWAFLTPAWLAAWRLTERLGRWRPWALAAAGLALLCYNGLAMVELLHFARRVYPR